MKLVQKKSHQLIKEVAVEMNIPLGLVTDIVASQFEFVRVEMAKGVKGEPQTFKTILLKYFGTFQFSEAKHNAIQKTVERIKNEKHSRELLTKE